MQAGVACVPVAEIKSKAFGADDSKVVDKNKDYRQDKVGIFVYFLQILRHLYLSSYFYFNLSFILSYFYTNLNKLGIV